MLSLSYSIAQMGWIGGLLTLLAFAAITWYTTFLLSEACIVNGVRQRTYMSESRLHETFYMYMSGFFSVLASAPRSPPATCLGLAADTQLPAP